MLRVPALRDLLLAALRVRVHLELSGPWREAEHNRRLTQNGIGLLQAQNPLGQSGPVSCPGHAHGKDRAFLHCRGQDRENRSSVNISNPTALRIQCNGAVESSSESRVTGNQDSWGPNLTSTPPSTRKLSIHRTTIILHPQGGGGFSVKDAKSTHPGTNFFHPALKCGHFWGRTQQLQHSHLEQKSLFYPAAEEFRFKRVQVGKKSIC